MNMTHTPKYQSRENTVWRGFETVTYSCKHDTQVNSTDSLNKMLKTRHKTQMKSDWIHEDRQNFKLYTDCTVSALTCLLLLIVKKS